MFDASGETLAVTSYLTLFATENAETVANHRGLRGDQVGQIDGQWKITKRHIDLDSATESQP